MANQQHPLDLGKVEREDAPGEAVTEAEDVDAANRKGVAPMFDVLRNTEQDDVAASAWSQRPVERRRPYVSDAGPLSEPA